jgi:septal ring factor EnvC (AmiA/AmiB activator)
MRGRRGTATLALLIAFGFLLLAGCAGTRREGLPDDPGLIRSELRDINTEIGNTEELIKGSKAQLQVQDNQELRNEIRSLETNLIHLQSRKRALEERLAEIEAGDTR